MGVLIRCNDASFENYVGVADYPIIPSLKNLYYMGTDANTSIKDHSNNGNDGTIVGTVTYNSKYAEFADTGTSNVMRAQELGQTESGLAGVAMFKKNGNRAIFSAGAGTATAGVMFMSANRLVFCTDTDTASRDIRYSLDDSDKFYIMAWIVTTSSYAVYVMRDGVLAPVSSGDVSGNSIKIYTGTTANFKKLRVGGSSYNFALDGTLDLAAAAFYVGTPTFANIRDAVDYFKVYGEHVGLSLN